MSQEIDINYKILSFFKIKAARNTIGDDRINYEE